MTTIDERPVPPKVPDRSRQAQGRALRRIWRIHFYAALFSAPFLVILSVTGLIILYTNQIQPIAHRDLLVVEQQTTTVALDTQKANAQALYPDLSLSMVVPPSAPDRSTMIELTDGSDLYQQVFVNPYTGKVLGSMVSGDDLVGLANRLHGYLAADNPTVTLPSLVHLFNADEPQWVDIKVGDIIIEVAAIWGLVLALTGLYLWWPRPTQRGKRLLTVRWSKGGRLRWRDVHASSGILLAALLIFFSVSGMPWSDYWGTAWWAATDKFTPNAEFDAPASTEVKAGDLDRLGNRIPWATQGDTIPASDASSGATPLSLDAVAEIARLEGAVPGYSVLLPIDDFSDPAMPVYGTYQVSNPWPGKLEEMKVFYLDQFSGKTLAVSGSDSWGTLQRATDWGINNHMGTQYGLLSKTLATLGCLLIIVSVATGVIMWWIRRPKGSAGLPRTPAGRASGPTTFVVVGVGVILGVVYPMWGVTALVIVAIDLGLRAVARRRAKSTAAETVSAVNA